MVTRVSLSKRDDRNCNYRPPIYFISRNPGHAKDVFTFGITNFCELTCR